LGEKTGDKSVTVKRVSDADRHAGDGSEPANEVETETVAMTSLDALFANHGYDTTCPEFIRITDYGGSELDVLKGALKAVSCAKLFCISGNVMRLNEEMAFAADVISFMNDHGFAIYNTYENHRIRFFNVKIDMLFVRKEIMDEMFKVGFEKFMTP